MSWNSTLIRRTPLRAKMPWKRGGKPDPAKPVKRWPKGKKTREWDADRAKLKAAFWEAGITYCEIQLDGCKGNDFLGFAHSLKRRNITTRDQWEEVALGCCVCHDVIEDWPEILMTERVRSIIANRETPVRSIFG